MNEPEHILQLREAVKLSPKNLPLRQVLAEALLSAGFNAEAITEFRNTLAAAPNHAGLKLGLARAFFANGDARHALVVVEDLVGSADAPARALVLHARLLAGIGEVEQAVQQYKCGVAKDSKAADPEFATRLGIRVIPEPESDAEAPAFRHDAEDKDNEAGEVFDGRVRTAGEGEELGPNTEIERPRTRFADVGGMDSLKEEIRLKIIYPLTHREMFKAYGKSIGGGILMYGPPGCGKTHLARATAGEVEAGFLAVGIHEVLDMWLGNSERNLHALFEQARRNAPCVLFFDEVDALGASRMR